MRCWRPSSRFAACRCDSSRCDTSSCDEAWASPARTSMCLHSSVPQTSAPFISARVTRQSPHRIQWSLCGAGSSGPQAALRRCIVEQQRGVNFMCKRSAHLSSLLCHMKIASRVLTCAGGSTPASAAAAASAVAKRTNPDCVMDEPAPGWRASRFLLTHLTWPYACSVHVSTRSEWCSGHVHWCARYFTTNLEDRFQVLVVDRRRYSFDVQELLSRASGPCTRRCGRAIAGTLPSCLLWRVHAALPHARPEEDCRDMGVPLYRFASTGCPALQTIECTFARADSAQRGLTGLGLMLQLKGESAVAGKEEQQTKPHGGNARQDRDRARDAGTL